MSIIPDWTLILQLVVFLAALKVINELIITPFTEALYRREGRVNGARADRDDALGKLDEKRSTYDVRLAQAHERADAKRHELRRDAEQRSQALLSEVAETSERRIRETRETVRQQVEEARAKLREDAVELGREMAESALGRALA